MIDPFQFSSLPEILFGEGVRNELPAAAMKRGKRVLLFTGSSSVHNSGHGEEIISGLKAANLLLDHEIIAHEPSPTLIDRIVDQYRGSGVDVVVAVGGGSVMDAGKAVSAMIPVEGSIRDYLEGVGEKKHPGDKIPFIAMPTTSGTGSEMTKNAVISEVGEQGFKKSLRHDNFIPELAIIDPEMMLSCPADLTAAAGMDAFTQLLESYVSVEANPMTDALALQGLKQIKKYLLRAYLEGDQNIEARSGMALAAMFSGITLSHAGLGLVHGFASPLGGFYHIPHGVACGSLMAPVFARTIDNLQDRPDHPAIQKLLIVSKVFADFKYKKDLEYLKAFKEKLIHITKLLEVPLLSAYGLNEEGIQKVVERTSHKCHPVKLTQEQMVDALRNRI
ncbi:MAG: iron-containing alcohol dehydrogenase [Bacteroidia bacterium]|nr:MAG: iron-containing alcohol dehydrogenase [Bacteroidia bacterium]